METFVLLINTSYLSIFCTLVTHIFTYNYVCQCKGQMDDVCQQLVGIRVIGKETSTRSFGKSITYSWLGIIMSALCAIQMLFRPSSAWEASMFYCHTPCRQYSDADAESGATTGVLVWGQSQTPLGIRADYYNASRCGSKRLHDLQFHRASAHRLCLLIIHHVSHLYQHQSIEHVKSWVLLRYINSIWAIYFGDTMV